MADSMALCFTQLWSIMIFEHKHFTRYCSNSIKVWCDI